MPPLTIPKLDLQRLVEIVAASILAAFASAYGEQPASDLARAA